MDLHRNVSVVLLLLGILTHKLCESAAAKISFFSLVDTIQKEHSHVVGNISNALKRLAAVLDVFAEEQNVPLLNTFFVAFVHCQGVRAFQVRKI